MQSQCLIWVAAPVGTGPVQASKASALAKKGEEEYIFQLVDTLKEYLGSLSEKVPTVVLLQCQDTAWGALPAFVGCTVSV
jgi:hypothetical protein